MVLSLRAQEYMNVDSILWHREFIAVVNLADSGLTAFTPTATYRAVGGTHWRLAGKLGMPAWQDVNVVGNKESALVEVENAYWCFTDRENFVYDRPPDAGRVEAITEHQGEAVVYDGKELYWSRSDSLVKLDLRGDRENFRCLGSDGRTLFVGNDHGVQMVTRRNTQKEKYKLVRLGRWWKKGPKGSIDDMHVFAGDVFAAGRDVWRFRGGAWEKLRLSACEEDHSIPQYLLRIDGELWIASLTKVVVYDLERKESIVLDQFKDSRGHAIPSADLLIKGITYSADLQQVFVRTLAHGVHTIHRRSMPQPVPCETVRVIVDVSESIGTRMSSAERSQFADNVIQNVNSVVDSSEAVVTKHSNHWEVHEGQIDSAWFYDCGFTMSIDLRNNISSILGYGGATKLCAANPNIVLCFRDKAEDADAFHANDIKNLINTISSCRGELRLYFFTNEEGKRIGWKRSKFYRELCTGLERSDCGYCRSLRLFPL